jgi:hypothetical protein
MTEIVLPKEGLLFRPTEIRGLWQTCGVRPLHLYWFLDSVFKAFDIPARADFQVPDDLEKRV